MTDTISNDITSLNKEATLLTGGVKTALFDCGMAHKLQVETIRQKLKGAPLDYLFITHSHYDHLGALPYIRKYWPQCSVCGSKYAQYVLTRPGALSTIRDFTMKAAQNDGMRLDPYPDSLMKIDMVLDDGQIVDLGGVQVQAIQLLGHTKCSMGYLIDGTTLIAAESTGYLNEHNQVIPAYLVSGMDALRSVEICKNLAPEVLVPPHREPVLMRDYPNYWHQCKASIRESQILISDSHCAGKTDADIFDLLKERYWVGEIRYTQPLFAFRANTEVMIQTTLAEAAQVDILHN